MPPPRDRIDDTRTRIVLDRLSSQDENLRAIADSLRCQRAEASEFREDITARVAQIETSVEIRTAVALAQEQQRRVIIKAISWTVGVILTLAGILIPVLWGKL